MTQGDFDLSGSMTLTVIFGSWAGAQLFKYKFKQKSSPILRLYAIHEIFNSGKSQILLNGPSLKSLKNHL